MAKQKFLGIPYPILRHPQGLFRSQGGVSQIKADMLVLLLSYFNERVMLLDYGADLRRFLFEPNDDILKDQVREAITLAINKWEPRVFISQIDISVPKPERIDRTPSDEESEHVLLIEIDFYDPENIKEIQQLVLEVPLP